MNTYDIVAMLLLLLIAGWLVTCAMLAYVGGWRRLATRFRAVSDVSGERFRFASMSLGIGLFPVRYRNAMYVTVGRSGLGLSVIFPFRLLHPPLFIPWSAVENVRPEYSWLAANTAVYIRDFDKRLLFRGHAGKKILETFSALA